VTAHAVERPSPWLVVRRQPSRTAIRLFCFPYAGGGASAFRQWTAAGNLDIWAVQLPGREDRFTHPPFTTLPSLLAPLRDALLPFLAQPFAFFGHSMGALVAYELTRELRRSAAPMPRALFVSGRRAPHLPPRKRPLHDLPDVEFERELRALNGTPAAVLADRELMALMAPLLRADFAVCETYAPAKERPLDIPIHALGGIDDPEATAEELEGWREHTTAFGGVRQFQGDHFYLQGEAPKILGAISEGLRRPGSSL
jgi:medium-chain acyl-[acyl-carrier-protein] hydrolase